MSDTSINFDGLETISESINVNFYLHSHDEYEIYLFLEGDSSYVIEENRYNLSPGDVILIRKNEMHRVYHNSVTRYHRFVLMVSPLFFHEYQCTEYEAAFKENSNYSNKIDSDIVHSSGLYDAILRMKKYSDNFTNQNTPIVKSTVVEILYIINKISSFASADTTNEQIKEIIVYINNNYQKNITLEMLEEKFYISRGHLCRLFKQSTGLTVQKYIRRKRITLVRSLVHEGKKLNEAAIIAGFNDYSSFYRAYLNECNKAPSSH